MKRTPSRITVIALSVVVMLLTSIAATFAAAPTTAAITTFLPPSPTPEKTLKPLVLLTVYNPWLMVIGSDEPTFALYDNGLVIYQRLNKRSSKPEFASVQLTPTELKALKADLKIDKSLYALDADETYYPKTDQPTNVIRLFDPVLGEKVISIYGDLYSDEEARQLAAPKRIIDLFDTLTSYTHPKAETWLPDHFEVMLWSYDTPNAVAWPQIWPTLTDPTTVKRESVYSLYVDIQEYDRYLELRQETNALRLDGKNWAFSARFPFPHELAGN